MPLWDTDNTCTPVPTLPCTNTRKHTHKELIRIRQKFTIYGHASLTDAGNRREKYISQVSLAAVTIVFLTCSSTGSIFCSTPCLAVNHTDRNSWIPNTVGVFVLEHMLKKKVLQRTDGLPKRAFIFCLSSRVMRTHASDRVSFTICRVEERRRQKSRVVERYCLVWSLCDFYTVKYRPQLKASGPKFLHQIK